MECVSFIVSTYLSNLKFIHRSLFPGTRGGGGTQLSISGFTSAASVASRTSVVSRTSVASRTSVVSRTLFRGGTGGQQPITLGGQQSITTGFQNQKSNPLSYVNNSKLTTAIADWIYGDGGSFQAAETKRFLKMINVARTVGDDYKPPGRGLIANELLDINFERTMATNKEKLVKQKKFGYTGMGDGATVGGMPLANEMWMAGDCPPIPFGVHDCTAHMAAGGKKDAEFIANQFIPMAEELDPDNAEGLIDIFYFDGASNVQKAGRILNEKYPTSHTLHGIEHVFSLFFDDMAKLKPIKVCFASSSILVTFICHLSNMCQPITFLSTSFKKQLVCIMCLVVGLVMVSMHNLLNSRRSTTVVAH